jgi:tetratricopeptide (TPR) repeat protein
MYAHELRCVGRTDEAISFFVRADALENAYFRRENIPPALDWHHAHNLSLLGSACQYVGQIRRADRYFAQERHLTPFTQYAAFNRRDWPEFLLNRKEFARALEAAQQMTRAAAPLARVAGYTLAGTALVGLHRLVETSRQLQAAQSEFARLSRPDAAAVTPYLDLLQIALLLERGPVTDAPPLIDRLERYTRAATSADSWSQGLFRLELLASIARGAGQWEIAERFASMMLTIDPYYGGSHYARALAARHREDLETASREFLAAEKYWAHADLDFPELLQTQKALALLGSAP